MIDVGTEPTASSLQQLTAYMDANENCGGCCGEIIVRDVPWHNIVLGAQWFEYRMSHLLIKTFESAMGYISVLPGAFSVYRWEALSRPACTTVDGPESSVLHTYFKPFTDPDRLTWRESNIYQLAEDRVMSEEIVKFRPADLFQPQYYTLQFLKSAKALTEGQPDLISLLNQRRRWINGSWFALLQVVDQCLCWSVMRTKRTVGRKVLMLVEYVYLIVTLLLTWLGVGLYYSGYASIMRRLFERLGVGWAEWMLNSCYLFFVAATYLMALSTRADAIAGFWVAASIFHSIIALFSCASGIYVIYYGYLFATTLTQIYVAVIVGVMSLAVLIYCEDLRKMFVFSLWYSLMTPTYINVLMVFALCRTDDLTWGTRGNSANSSTKDLYSAQKTKYLVLYATCNFLGAAVVRQMDAGTGNDNIEYLYLVGAMLMVVPFVGEVGYHVALVGQRCRQAS